LLAGFGRGPCGLGSTTKETQQHPSSTQVLVILWISQSVGWSCPSTHLFSVCPIDGSHTSVVLALLVHRRRSFCPPPGVYMYLHPPLKGIRRCCASASRPQLVTYDTGVPVLSVIVVCGLMCESCICLLANGVARWIALVVSTWFW
jgi:hypothetical protein